MFLRVAVVTQMSVDDENLNSRLLLHLCFLGGLFCFFVFFFMDGVCLFLRVSSFLVLFLIILESP